MRKENGERKISVFLLVHFSYSCHVLYRFIYCMFKSCVKKVTVLN
ncbi:hypothetical protein [Desulfurobacterium crinifex]